MDKDVPFLLLSRLCSCSICEHGHEYVQANLTGTSYACCLERLDFAVITYMRGVWGDQGSYWLSMME